MDADLGRKPDVPAREIHPATLAVLEFFEYGHLPPRLQEVSARFYSLAHGIASSFEGPEVTVCLRKLLEAKDCAVRAALEPPEGVSGMGWKN